MHDKNMLRPTQASAHFAKLGKAMPKQATFW